MPILVKCECGRSLRVKDEAAGRRIKCPDCEAVLRVPKPEEPDVVEDAEAEEPPPSRKPGPPPVPKKSAVAPAQRKSRFEDEDEDEDDKPKPRKPKKKKKGPVAEESGTSPLRTILGGVASMVIAGVWFGLGLASDRIYIWPPIMFVLGFLALCRGIWEHQQNS